MSVVEDYSLLLIYSDECLKGTADTTYIFIAEVAIILICKYSHAHWHCDGNDDSNNIINTIYHRIMLITSRQINTIPALLIAIPQITFLMLINYISISISNKRDLQFRSQQAV